MRGRAVAPLSLLLALLIATLIGGAQTAVPPQAHLAITGVTIIDAVAGRSIPNQTVVVDAGRVTAVGPPASIQVPAAARVVDGRGQFLIPGLIDTHVHLGNSADRERLPAVGPLLAHGVTGVRDAGAGGQDDWLVALRSRVAKGDVLAPRLYVSGMVSGRSVARAKAVDAATLARDLVRRGVDGLKIRDGLSADDVRAVIGVGASANVPVYGHTYDSLNRDRDEVYTLEAIRAGAAGTMHIMGMPLLGSRPRPAPPAVPKEPANWEPWWIYYATWWRQTDAAAEAELIKTMIQQGAWLEPTLVTEDFVVNSGVYRDNWPATTLPVTFDLVHSGFPKPAGGALQEYRDAFGRMKSFVGRFHAAGGTITTGTDCLPLCGYGLPDELRLLVEAGLTPAAALRAATIDAAKVLSWDRAGRIAPEFFADLVLLDRNPLDDIANIRGVRAVIVNGRYLDRATLDAILK